MLLKRILTAGAALLLVSACSSAEEVAPADTPTQEESTATEDAAEETTDDTAQQTDDTAATTQDQEAAMEPTARGEIGRLKVDVPEGWEEWMADDPIFPLRYSEGDGDDAPTLSLSGYFGDYGTARVGLSTLIGDIQVGTPGFSVESTTDIEVPGATSAVRLDFVYGTEETNGVFEGMWIVASDDETDTSVAVALSAAELDDDVRSQVQDSMTMLEPATGANG